MKNPACWKGKLISDCSREELLEVIDYLTPYYLNQFDPINIRKNTLGTIEMWKRGESTCQEKSA